MTAADGRAVTDDGSNRFVQLVQGGLVPRYVYAPPHGERTPGVLLAGAATFDADGARRIVAAGASALDEGRERWGTAALDLGAGEVVHVTLAPTHPSWVERLVPASRRGDYVQVTPIDHVTVDVVPMDQPYDADTAGAWRWLSEPWEFAVPSTSTVATNLAALRGEPVTEVSRWEHDYLEAFAGSGPDTPRDEVRFVGFPLLVGADPSLATAAGLDVGESIRRPDASAAWALWPAGR